MKPPAAPLILLLAAGFIAAGCSPGEGEHPPLQPLPDSVLFARRLPAPPADTTAPGPELPDIALASLDGDSLRLSGYRGRTLLINFWATWCPPCRTDLPALNELQAGLHADSVAVVGVSVDTGREKVRAFAEAYDLRFPVALDDGHLSGILGGVYSLPTTFIVGPDGRVLERITGSVPPEQLRARLRAKAFPMQ